VSLPLHAQGLRELRERGQFGGGFLLAVPVGEFDRFVNLGGGVNLFGVFNLSPGGVLGLRVNGSVIGYGSSREPRSLSQTVPEVIVDVRTTNWITTMGLGPQVTLGQGPVRVYSYGTVGFAYFSTVSSAGDHAHTFASSTNLDDWRFATALGGGLQFRVANRHRPVYLDLAVHGQHNGRTRYLRSGGIETRPDGSILITPIESQANLVTLRLGVSVSLF